MVFLDFKILEWVSRLGSKKENNEARESERERELGHTEILTTNQNQTKLDV